MSAEEAGRSPDGRCEKVKALATPGAAIPRRRDKRRETARYGLTVQMAVMVKGCGPRRHGSSYDVEMREVAEISSPKT
jgi:hypothetical protein